MLKKTVLAIVIILLVPALFGLVNAQEVKATAPSITIYPSTIINPNEKVLVVGKNWTPNGTVVISLVLPSGTTLNNVASGVVNSTGKFTATFTAPNVYGTGYIKATEGSSSTSVAVFFNGQSGNVNEIKVTWSPSKIYVNDTVYFNVDASFLGNHNYVLDTTIFYMDKEVIYYSVIHYGYATVKAKFDEVGTYFVSFNIEHTQYNKTIQITVNKENTSGGNHPPSGNNLTISISPQTGSLEAIIKVSSKTGYMPSGLMTVITPDGNVERVSIYAGIGKMQLTTSGTYLLQFKDNKTGLMASKTWTYHMSVQLQVSGFVDSNKATVNILVNGQNYNGQATITVIKPDGSMDTLQYSGTPVTYTADKSGTYQFSATVLGTSVKTSLSFNDKPIISNVMAYYSKDLNAIIITGSVYGQYTQKPMSGMTVTATSWQLSAGKVSATTGYAGDFKIVIPLQSQDMGQLAQITIKAGSSSKQITVSTPQTIANEIGWIALGILVLIIAVIIVLKRMGYIKSRRGKKGSTMFNYGMR